MNQVVVDLSECPLVLHFTTKLFVHNIDLACLLCKSLASTNYVMFVYKNNI